MSKEEELHSIFFDYLLVTKHTGLGLMNKIYDDAFIKKLRLTQAKVGSRCTGVAFDGHFFSLDIHEALAARMIEATEFYTSTTEVQSLMQWLLCTRHLAHRLERVT